MTRWRAVLLVLLAALVASIGLRISEPVRDFETLRGQRGQAVEINDGGMVTASELDAGTALVVYGEARPTQGIFVGVEVILAATGSDQVRLDNSALLTDQRRYLPVDYAALSPEPGFEQTAWFVYELDPTDLAGLVLELSKSEIVHGYQQRVQIDLAIGSTEAAELRAAAAGRALDLPRIEERGIV